MMDMKEDIKRKGLMSEIVRRLGGLETNVRRLLSISGGGIDVIGSTGTGAGAISTVPASTTYYSMPFLNNLLAGTPNYQWPVGGVLSNLNLRLNAAQPGTGSLVFRVAVNGVASALSLTVPAGSALQSYSNTVDKVVIVAGDLIRFELQNNALSASPVPTAMSMKIQY